MILHRGNPESLEGKTHFM